MGEQPSTVTHANGLSLRLPATLIAEHRAEGFVIYPPGGRDRRVPAEVAVTLTSATPAGPWPQQKTVAKAVVSFRVDESDGGSGGKMFELTSFTPLGQRFVAVSQVTQAEPAAEPDFSVAWRVWGALVLP